MRFFSQFPLTEYRINGESTTSSLIDIYRHVDVNETLIDDLTNYRFYDIKDGERPDIVSYKLYGSPEYHWSFFIINEKLNNMNDWPRSYQEQSTYIDRKYDEYSVLEFLPNQEVLENKYPAQVIPSSVTVSNLPDGNGTYTRVDNGEYGEPRWLLSQPDGQNVLIYINKYDPNDEQSYAWTIRDRTYVKFSDNEPFIRGPLSTLNEVLTKKFWTIDEWFSSLRENPIDNVLLYGGSDYNDIWTLEGPMFKPDGAGFEGFDLSATHFEITNSSDSSFNKIFPRLYEPSSGRSTYLFFTDDNLLTYDQIFTSVSVQEGFLVQPIFIFGDEIIKYHNYFGNIDFNDPNIRLKVKDTTHDADIATYDSERLQLWVKNISNNSFLSNDEVTYVLDYDTNISTEREAWLNDVILPWLQENHFDQYSDLINDERIVIDNILPFVRGSIVIVNDVTYNSGYRIGHYENDQGVSDTGIINEGNFVRGSISNFQSNSITDLLYSSYLPTIEFKTSRSWLKSYNAPYNYFDNDDNEICAYDALTADPDNDNYITYFSAEEEENEAKRNIRVLKDSDIESFADYYKELINE